MVILSGGLDSTVCLALAVDVGDEVACITFDYGQRHRVELERAAEAAAFYGCEQLIVHLDAGQWGGSALTDPDIPVPGPSPDDRSEGEPPIPMTYVPARNLIFLSVAVGVAEARDADAVHLGVNALDYSGYPDCRPAFIESFRATAALALKRGVEGRPVEVRTPLAERDKAEIVTLGMGLGAPLHLTWSCYRGGFEPCRDCDACRLRAKGFADAGVPDPALGGPAG